MSKQLIDEGHERFLDAMRANDAAALLEVLTEDVVFYPPGIEPVRGKAAVRAWYEGINTEMLTEAIDVPAREVVVAGDLGIEEGKYVWKLAPVGGGDTVTATGHFIAIWRRQADGGWKCTSDIWNSSDAAG